MQTSIRLILADDHVLMREGLKQIFNLDKQLTVVAEAGNGDEVLSTLAETPCDILLLDLSMPGISGTEMVKKIAKQWPTLPVLVLSMYNEPQVAMTVLNSGARGFITKDQDPQTLLNAIHRVSQHQRYIDPTLAEAIIFSNGDTSEQYRYATLSQREKQILAMLTRGDSINAIAEALCISNKTVSTHKARMVEKMQFSSNAEMIRFGIKHNLS